MSRAIRFEPDAWEDLNYWIEQDIKIAKRICGLLKEIKRNPFEGIGKPEPLKHNYHGYWSRRIDKVNRLVYKVTEDAIIVMSCKNHYN